MELTLTLENAGNVINHLSDQMPIIYSIIAGSTFFSITCIIYLQVQVTKLKTKIDALSPKKP
jgi:hypothetical protein